MSTGYETAVLEQFKETSFEAVREEYPKYFEALELHPRQLIGQTVPRIGAEGTEVLRDADDAANWQEAVRQILTNEIRDRATRQMDDAAPAMEQLHAAIELFQNNVDLVPGTKQFDKELADRFATFATPYENRVDGRLLGYNIPTQPLINQLRTQLAAERAARSAAPPPAAPVATGVTPAAGAPAAATPASPVEQPQAGIPAKAGASSDADDFSTLFGTIGLPNLRI